MYFLALFFFLQKKKCVRFKGIAFFFNKKNTLIDVLSVKKANYYINRNKFISHGTRQSIRYYSTKCNNNIINYDSDKDKLIILDLCNNKSGIYMWTNKLNNKRYIGSSVNLKRRLLEYYNVNRLLNQNSMSINNALLKYGYSNFTISILEFCDINNLITSACVKNII